MHTENLRTHTISSIEGKSINHTHLCGKVRTEILLYFQVFSTSVVLYHLFFDLSIVFEKFFPFLHFPLFKQTFLKKIVHFGIFTNGSFWCIINKLQDLPKIHQSYDAYYLGGFGYWYIRSFSNRHVGACRFFYFFIIVLTMPFKYDIIMISQLRKDAINNERKAIDKQKERYARSCTHHSYHTRLVRTDYLGCYTQHRGGSLGDPYHRTRGYVHLLDPPSRP